MHVKKPLKRKQSHVMSNTLHINKVLSPHLHVSKCANVPVCGVMGVFEPKVHHIVQFSANSLSILLQLRHWHRPFHNEGGKEDVWQTSQRRVTLISHIDTQDKTQMRRLFTCFRTVSWANNHRPRSHFSVYTEDWSRDTGTRCRSGSGSDKVTLLSYIKEYIETVYVSDPHWRLHEFCMLVTEKRGKLDNSPRTAKDARHVVTDCQCPLKGRDVIRVHT